jgi:flagellar basal-body rod protein FlgB
MGPAAVGQRGTEHLKRTVGIADTTNMNVTDSQFNLLARMLDLASLRHRVIAQNVANVNTPGYHRRDIAFEDAITRQLVHHEGTSAAKVEPKLIEHNDEPERLDGNNIDIDAEMGRLSKNSLLFNAYAQLLAGQIASMRSAITGR